jgi:hypothetical protein
VRLQLDLDLAFSPMRQIKQSSTWASTVTGTDYAARRTSIAASVAR